MITRTFITYFLSCSVFEKTTKEVSDQTIAVPLSKYNAKNPEKSAAKILNDDSRVVLSVNSINKVENLFGITEEDFLAHAVPVTRPASQQKKETA